MGWGAGRAGEPGQSSCGRIAGHASREGGTAPVDGLCAGSGWHPWSAKQHAGLAISSPAPSRPCRAIAEDPRHLLGHAGLLRNVQHLDRHASNAPPDHIWLRARARPSADLIGQQAYLAWWAYAYRRAGTSFPMHTARPAVPSRTDAVGPGARVPSEAAKVHKYKIVHQSAH